MYMSMTVRTDDKEHPVDYEVMAKAMIAAAERVKNGNTAAMFTMDFPHTHQGDSDNARYDVEFEVE